MNVDSGELRMFKELVEAESDMAVLARTNAQIIPEGFERVPPELEEAAKKKLAGKDSAMVSLSSGGKLSKWAAQKRKEKRKAAKLSRKANRKKR